MRVILIVFLAAVIAAFAAIGSAAEQPNPELQLFRERIVPLLYEKCFSCHGGTAKEGGYSVADTETMFMPGDSGAVPVSVGQPAKSELLARLVEQDVSLRMPLDAESLNAQEIEAIRVWIGAGAKVPTEKKPESLLELYGASTSSSKSPATYSIPSPVSALLFSPDGKTLLVAGYAEVLIWNLSQQSLEYRLPTRGKFISDMKWAPGGKLVVASGSPGMFGVLESFEFAARTRLAAFGFSRDVCSCVTASPYRNELAAGFVDGRVVIYSLESYLPRVESVAHAASVTSVYWSSREDRLFSSSLDRSAKSFAVADGQLQFAYADHERSVGGIVDTQYGPVTLDETGTLRIWSEGEEARPQAKQEGLAQIVQRLANSNGILILTDKDRLRCISIVQDEIDDVKAKEGESDKEKPKKKKRTRFKELSSLQSIPNCRILSVTASANNLVAAGMSNGQVAVWRMGESNSPWKTWLVRP